MNQKILVVEDEPSIADTLIYTLEKEGFDPTRVATLSEAREHLAARSYTAIVLDVGLPDGNGFEFLKEIRKDHSTPVLFLTARDDEVDRIVGLEIGADDYITKPFSPREVSARVKAILRRTTQVPEDQKSTLFLVEEDKRIIRFQGNALELSRYEYGILSLLLKRPGQVYSRQQIMEHVWPDPDMSFERTVDTHIKTIRGKLKEISDEEILVTHRGVGYSIKER
ncbi:MAG: two-component system response regulator CreB [Candidatus Nitronauta litoralis]|uniref:Two-component system response regulator CreB n=1 Tax=Candidatus Nitronauta litoralis TaxID=2705533 RepID=A0A7T0BV14_9BACT|nr:MAG: two-component system response regulator CreB [Candidatus Nitronauta litoralis]